MLKTLFIFLLTFQDFAQDFGNGNFDFKNTSSFNMSGKDSKEFHNTFSIDLGKKGFTFTERDNGFVEQVHDGEISLELGIVYRTDENNVIIIAYTFSELQLFHEKGIKKLYRLIFR